MGAIYQLLYQLNHHQVSGWPLDRWLMAGLVGLGVVAGLGWLPAGRWLLVAAAVVLVLGIVLRRLAQRRDYVHFVAGVPGAAEAHTPLAALEHVPVYATGRFEVNDEARRFSALPAEYTSFAVREHAILARVRPARFLLVGRWPEEQIGMWYIFFPPKAIRAVQPGHLAFGRRVRPALRVEIEVIKKAENGQSLRSAAKDRVYNDVVYLAFDSAHDCQRVWSNLVADAPAVRPAAL
jgi:hypothetical protein